MKILIHGINYSPELTGIGKYTGEMAEWLVDRGHNVRVVTAPPYYPEWKIKKEYSAWRYKKEYIHGATVYRCPLWVPKKVNGPKRIVHLASFALSSLPVILIQALWRPHIILSIAPAFCSTPFSLLCSFLSRAKAWLHIQDFELDAALNLGLLKIPKFRRVARYIESSILRRFNGVSTISQRMMENLCRKGVVEPNTFLFPNWVDTEWIYPLDGANPMRAELGISTGTIVALYSGNMGQKQGFEILAETARNLEPHTNIKFIFCGEGSACLNLMSMTSDLSNVIYLPLQPVEKLNLLLNLADVHLLPQRAYAADLVMPSKLTGILASGKPVIATAKPNTEIAEVLKDRGIVVNPDDSNAFNKALSRLAESPEERKKMGKASRDFAVNHLNKEEILTRFENNLCEIVNNLSSDTVTSIA
jgi:colanic acid biosynthesis glycosyl transferase WcaI